MDFISPRDTINAISQHLRTLYKPYAGAQFRFVFLGEGSAEQLLTGAVLFRDQHVASRAQEMYRQGDKKFVFAEYWCHEQWEAVTLLSKLLSGQAEIEGHRIKATFSRSEFSRRTYPLGRDWWTGYDLRSRRDRDETWKELHVPQGDLVRRGASPYQGPDHAINDRVFNQDTYNLPSADLPTKDTIITICPDSRARILSADWQPQQKKLYLEVELKVPPEQIELQISHIESKDRSQSVPLKSGNIEVDIPGDASSLSIYLLDHSDSTISHFDLDGYHNRFGKADPNTGRFVRGRTVLSEPEFVFGDQTESDPEEDFLQLSSRANDDRQFMEMAIDEARKSTGEDGRSHPKVGAVVVKDGRVLALAKAHRGEFPGCHAEYIALEKKLVDQSLAGSTVYTTLEPCTSRNHPKIPCASRLIERKVARVVIGILDPNPKISGRGQRALRKASIVTDFFPHTLMEQIEELNREFIRHQESEDQPSAPAAKEPDRFDALEELAGQLVEELSSYRPLDRTVLVPWFEEFRRLPGKFARYPQVRINALDLQNVLDRMFVAKQDHEDSQPELRAELDAALKTLLSACDQARNIASEHPKINENLRDTELPMRPKVRPVSYGQQSEKSSKVGLIIANDGEPA
jgi:pyrimidine deaminase RibD-like protein